MILGVPVSELLLLAALIIIAGFITGILAGLFGIGGGALIVPVLYEVFRVLGVPDEVRFQLCVGTSIAIIVPTNVLSYFTHRGKGAVMMAVESRGASNAKAKQELGWKPRYPSWRQGFPAAYASLAAAGGRNGRPASSASHPAT